MKALLVLATLALALSLAPVAAAEHGCAGDPSVAAACGFHHNGHECYAFYVGGQHLERMDVC